MVYLKILIIENDSFDYTLLQFKNDSLDIITIGFINNAAYENILQSSTEIDLF